MLQPLDGPAAQTSLTVTDSTVQEAKVGASAFEERKVISFYSDKAFYVYWGDGVTTPSTVTVQNDGITFPKNSLQTIEAAPGQPVFVLSVTGTADIKIVERA